MHAFAALIDVSHGGAEALALQERLWNFAATCVQDDSLASWILHEVKKPLDEMRFAALHVMSGAVLHSWGLKRLCEKSGVMEFILDRRTEYSKLGHEWKYRIVKRIAANAWFVQSTTFPTTKLHASIVEYVATGPFGSNAEVTVMEPQNLSK